jgi:hypothetical protein
MIALESYPAFRTAQLEWEAFTRDPVYLNKNDTAMVTPEQIRRLGNAYDSVLVSSVLWARSVQSLSATRVQPEQSIGPQLGKMLGWIVHVYFKGGEEFPGGTFRERDQDVPHEVPCWDEDYETYVHVTGGLKVKDLFILTFLRAARDYIRALQRGDRQKAERHSFVSTYRAFMQHLNAEREKAQEQHRIAKQDRYEQQDAIQAGWQRKRKMKAEAGQERFPSAAERRGSAFTRKFQE